MQIMCLKNCLFSFKTILDLWQICDGMSGAIHGFLQYLKGIWILNNFQCVLTRSHCIHITHLLTCLHIRASLSFNWESSDLCLSISPSLCLSISPSSKREEGPLGSRCVNQFNRETWEKWTWKNSKQDSNHCSDLLPFRCPNPFLAF